MRKQQHIWIMVYRKNNFPCRDDNDTLEHYKTRKECASAIEVLEYGQILKPFKFSAPLAKKVKP